MMQTLGLFILLLLFSANSHTDIFKWIDEQGKIHFGEEVPEAYQGESITPSNSNVVTLEKNDIKTFLQRGKSTSEKFEFHSNRSGSTYKTVKFFRDKGPEHCLSACLQDQKCQAWTYQRADYYDKKRLKCLLKSRIPEQNKSQCCTSGVKHRTIQNMDVMALNVNYQGSTLKKFRAANADPQVCLASCSRNQKCKAWTYGKPIENKRPYPMCWLKYAVPEQSINNSMISGKKLGH